MKNKGINKFIKILKSKGFTPNDIQQALYYISMLAHTKLEQHLETVFEKEDKKNIEKVSSKEEAEKVLALLYKKRTGNDIQETMNSIYEDIESNIETFIEEFKNSFK